MTLEEYQRILKEYRQISGGGGFTPLREKILDIYEKQFEEKKSPPTYQVVADKIGISRQAIHYHIKWLVSNDYLKLPPPTKIKKPSKKIIW